MLTHRDALLKLAGTLFAGKFSRLYSAAKLVRVVAAVSSCPADLIHEKFRCSAETELKIYIALAEYLAESGVLEPALAPYYPPGAADRIMLDFIKAQREVARTR